MAKQKRSPRRLPTITAYKKARLALKKPKLRTVEEVTTELVKKAHCNLEMQLTTIRAGNRVVSKVIMKWRKSWTTVLFLAARTTL